MTGGSEFKHWQRPFLDILAPEQVEKVYEAALEILERVGGEFHDPEAVELLHGAGARVDGIRVRIPAHMVESRLAAAPRPVVLYDRNGAPRMVLEGRNTYYGPGSDTIHVLDPHTGERRKAVIADVARAALVSDGLPDIDFVMSSALAEDVPEASSDAHHFLTMMENTEKPIIPTAWNREGLEVIFEMMKAVRGGEAALREKPFALVYLMAISPLRFPKESLQKLLFCAEHGLPMVWTAGCPTMGATGPIFPAGSMAVGVAEALAGIVLAQLKRPGTPMAMGSSFGSLDMATGLRPYNGPEPDFGHACVAEIGRFLGLPSWGVGGCTDSNTLDEQAMAEASQSLFMSAVAGNNIIHDLGYLDGGLTSSLELLVMCHEFVGRARRFLQGFTVSPETLAIDVIDQLGPGSSRYLTHPTTKANYRREIWTPDLTSRQGHDRWRELGGKTFRDRAREKLFGILDHHQPKPLPSGTHDDLHRILAEHDKRMADWQ